MDKQNIDIKLEVHSSQEKSPTQISELTPTPTTLPASNNNQTKFALLIFSPLALIFLVLVPSFFLNFSFFKSIFFIVAGVNIYIYARFAFEIHDIMPKETKIIDIVKDGQLLKKEVKRDNWYFCNQYWFNGLGAFVGWVALYILLFYRIGIEINHPYCYWICFFENIKLQDFVLVLVSFFGITGYLPYAALIGKLKP